MVSKTTLIFAVLLATVYVAKCAPAEAPKEAVKATQEESKERSSAQEGAHPQHKERSALDSIRDSFTGAISKAREQITQMVQSTLDVFSNAGNK